MIFHQNPSESFLQKRIYPSTIPYTKYKFQTFKIQIVRLKALMFTILTDLQCHFTITEIQRKISFAQIIAIYSTNNNNNSPKHQAAWG